MPFASYKHDSHSHGRGRVQRSTNQPKFVVFPLFIFHARICHGNALFCNLLLKTLFAADVAGRAWGCPRLSDNTCDRKRQWGILTDKILRQIYV